MRIAFVAWGSLVSETLCLKIRSRWKHAGPALPIEFARISDNLRLTLVILENAKPVTTYFAEAVHDRLADAIQNLRLREGAPRCENPEADVPIAAIQSDGERVGKLGGVQGEVIVSWLSERRYDAAVWTALPVRLKYGEYSIGTLTAENAARYLRSLEPPVQARAKAYFDSVPVEVQTGLRRQIESLMGWRGSNAG